MWNTPAARYIRTFLGALLVVSVLAFALTQARSEECHPGNTMPVIQEIIDKDPTKFKLEVYDTLAMRTGILTVLKGYGVSLTTPLPEVNDIDAVIGIVMDNEVVKVGFVKGGCVIVSIRELAPLKVWRDIITEAEGEKA